MKWALATGLFLGLLFPITVSPCEFHPVPSFDKGLVKVEAFGTSGLTGFYYDTDGDGVPARALLFQTGADGHYIQWPLFYFEDLGLDGLVNEVWVDIGGDGKCTSIRLYWKRNL